MNKPSRVSSQSPSSWGSGRPGRPRKAAWLPARSFWRLKIQCTEIICIYFYSFTSQVKSEHHTLFHCSNHASRACTPSLLKSCQYIMYSFTVQDMPVHLSLLKSCQYIIYSFTGQVSQLSVPSQLQTC